MPKNLDFFFISASASAEMSMGQSLQANQAKKGYVILALSNSGY